MAESLTTHEIEDVLSSIRRLVSEDFRPASRTAGAAHPPVRPMPEPVPSAVSETVPEPVEKLILTASLRVADPDWRAAPADAGPALEGDILPPPEADAAGPSAALQAVEEAIWTLPLSGEAGYVEEIDSAAAAPSPRTAPRGHWTAETVPEVAWIETEVDWAPQEPVPFVAHRRAGRDPSGPAPLGANAAAQATATPAMVSPSAADEAAVDVLPTADDADDSSLLMAEAAVAETVIEAMGEAGLAEAAREAAQADAAAGPVEAGAAPIDDSRLRDAVRRIIREELAGSLGERITRNVRKLVRIEVNRVLSSREFE